MSNFVLRNTAKGTERECETRAEAEEKKADMVSLGASESDFEIVSPDGSDEENKRESDDTDAQEGEVFARESNAETQALNETTEMVEEPKQPVEELPDEQPGVGTDPLDWVPSDFIDHIDGQPAINRKGYDVLAHHYDISVQTEVMVSPSENDYEYAEVVATAVTADGIEYKAHGSAHVERGDDSYLLLEMADTRAAKRATARATGVGLIAVQELKNDL